MIKNRAAIESAAKIVVDKLEHAACDSISECIKCNALFLAKSVLETLQENVQLIAYEPCEAHRDVPYWFALNTGQAAPMPPIKKVCPICQPPEQP